MMKNRILSIVTMCIVWQGSIYCPSNAQLPPTPQNFAQKHGINTKNLSKGAPILYYNANVTKQHIRHEASGLQIGLKDNLTLTAQGVAEQVEKLYYNKLDQRDADEELLEFDIAKLVVEANRAAGDRKATFSRNKPAVALRLKQGFNPWYLVVGLVMNKKFNEAHELYKHLKNKKNVAIFFMNRLEATTNSMATELFNPILKTSYELSIHSPLYDTPAMIIALLSFGQVDLANKLRRNTNIKDLCFKAAADFNYSQSPYLTSEDIDMLYVAKKRADIIWKNDNWQNLDWAKAFKTLQTPSSVAVSTALVPPAPIYTAPVSPVPTTPTTAVPPAPIYTAASVTTVDESRAFPAIPLSSITAVPLSPVATTSTKTTDTPPAPLLVPSPSSQHTGRFPGAGAPRGDASSGRSTPILTTSATFRPIPSGPEHLGHAQDLMPSPSPSLEDSRMPLRPDALSARLTTRSGSPRRTYLSVAQEAEQIHRDDRPYSQFTPPSSRGSSPAMSDAGTQIYLD